MQIPINTPNEVLKSTPLDHPGEEVLRSQAWSFYEIVAAQRLTVINFYLGIATALAGGQMALLQSDRFSNAAAGLGALLVSLSFVFWKWDTRSSDLIKLAEDILRHYEHKLVSVDEDCSNGMLFERERLLTKERKQARRVSLKYYFTYRTCLNVLYTLFSLIGLSVAVIALAT